MGLPKDDGDEFRREADAVIHRLRIEGKLDALRAILERLLSAVSTMNLGDVGDCLLGEEVAEREAIHLLDDLGCLAVLKRRKGDGTVRFELFSKLRLAYLADKIDAARSRSDSSRSSSVAGGGPPFTTTSVTHAGGARRGRSVFVRLSRQPPWPPARRHAAPHPRPRPCSRRTRSCSRSRNA
jgi:hypothetical protein